MQWTLYELSKNPDVLEEVRREHSAVLGPDPDAAGEMLKAQPHLLNNLPWTTAVIKEVLRLYPPASGVRYAEPGYAILSQTFSTFFCFLLTPAQTADPPQRAKLSLRWQNHPDQPLLPAPDGGVLPEPELVPPAALPSIIKPTALLVLILILVHVLAGHHHRPKRLPALRARNPQLPGPGDSHADDQSDAVRPGKEVPL